MKELTIPSFNDLNIEEQRKIEYNKVIYGVKKFTKEVEDVYLDMLNKASTAKHHEAVAYDRKIIKYLTNIPPGKVDNMDSTVVLKVVECLVNMRNALPKKKEPNVKKSEK